MVVFVLGGAGMLGFWQLGCADVRIPVAARTDPASRFVGASAGAVTAALMACNLEPRTCVAASIAAMRRGRVFERKMGLVGVSGRVMRDFLESILPVDAHQLCTGRVHIFVQRFPCVDDTVSVFATRAALIDTLVASGYLPFLAGPCPFQCLSGMLTYDGAINLRRVEMLLFGVDKVVYEFINYQDDPSVSNKAFFRAHSPEWIWEVYEKGRAFGILTTS